MVKIQIKNDLKHLSDVHELLNQLENHLKDPQNDNFVLDLSGLSFVSPIGAISLLMLFEETVKLNNYHVILPEGNKNLVTYIERINFFKHCPVPIFREFDEKYDLDKLSQRRRNDKRKVLLEITQIEEYDDIDILYDSVLYILKNHGMKSEQVSKIANIVTELGTNILDHSGKKGYAAIQYYPKFNKIMIGIADSGIGIVNGILEVEENSETDLEVIKRAFSGGYTSQVDIDRGWGLTDARDYSHVGAKETSFQIRTHKSLYNIGKNNIEVIKEDIYFPGTYYLIEIVF